MMAAMRFGFVFDSNARRPVAISYRTAPSAKMSVRASGLFAIELLGRHVLERADDRPFFGEGFLRA